VGDVLTFDEASVTFKVSNHNRIFVIQSKITPYKVVNAQNRPKTAQTGKKGVQLPNLTKAKSYKMRLHLLDGSHTWPKDAYMLIGLIPRDTRTRFTIQESVSQEDQMTLTDYLSMYSSSFFKWHETTYNFKELQILLTVT
jgi:hypothetical protein